MISAIGTTVFAGIYLTTLFFDATPRLWTIATWVVLTVFWSWMAYARSE